MMHIRGIHYCAKRFFSGRYKDISIKDASRNLFDYETRQESRWPHNARAAFNISFDDFCGKSLSNSPYDYGGACGQGINSLFDRFLQRYPYVKVSLCTVPNAQFKNWEGIFYGKESDENVFDLSSGTYDSLIDWIKEKGNQIEIVCHGYNHIQRRIPLFLGAAEFEFSDHEEARNKLKKAFALFDRIGLSVRGFRPPAWGIGYNSGFALLDALQEFDLDYASLSSPLSGLNWAVKRVSNIYPQWFNNILNIPQNVSLAWPIEKILETIDRIIEFEGLISLMGHYNAEGAWMPDGIGPNTMHKLESVTDHLNKRYPNQIWYATLGEVARFWRSAQYGKLP